MNKSRAYFAYQGLSDSYPQRHITFLIALMTFRFLAAYLMFYAICNLLRTFRSIAVFSSSSVNIHRFIPFTYCLRSFLVLFVDLSPTAFLE